MVHKMLLDLGIETPMKPGPQGQFQNIRECFKVVMESLDLNLEDDSLQRTPERIAQMYTEEIFYGLNYDNWPEFQLFENTMQVDEMIAETCTVMSTCEHHFVPFIGKAYIGYIPKTKIIGLSKFNRVVDFFARRPQVQERLTEQIAATLRYCLGVEDVAVVLKCEHYCIRIRGVQDQQSVTVTSKMGGAFKNKPEARAEFLALVNNH